MDIEKIKVGDVIHDIRDAGALREIAGKGLSTNDYTNEDKSKLEGIEADAQKNKIESIKVNGSDVTPDPNKAVNVSVPTKMSDLNLDGGDMASGASLRFKNASSSMVIQPFGIVKESNNQSHLISFPDRGGTVALTSDIPDVSSKQDTIQDLSEIRSGAALGSTAYQKPSAGIPASDMTTAVQNSLELADNSVQAEPIGSIIPPVNPSEFATKEEVSQLGRDLYGGYMSEVLQDGIVHQNYYMDKARNLIYESTSGAAIIEFPCVPGDKYEISIPMSNNVAGYYLGYSNREFARGVPFIGVPDCIGTSGAITYTIEAAENYNYIYIGFTYANGLPTVTRTYRVSAIFAKEEDLASLRDEENLTKAVVDSVIDYEQIINNYDGSTTPGYVTSSGGKNGDLPYLSSGLIPVEGGKVYFVNRPFVAGKYAANIRVLGSDRTTAMKVRIASTGQEYAEWYQPNNAGTGVAMESQIKIPDNGAYLQFTIWFSATAPTTEESEIVSRIMIQKVGDSYDPDFVPHAYVEQYAIDAHIKNSALSNKSLKILFLGNSFLDASINYAPFLLYNITPDIDVTFVELVKGGSSLSNWYDILTGVDTQSTIATYIFKKGQSAWMQPTLQGATLKDRVEYALQMYDYDAIVFQQVSTSVDDYSTYQPYLNNIVKEIFDMVGHPVKLGWLLTPTNGSNYATSVTVFEGIIGAVKKVIDETAIEFVIPCGTAMQNARTTILQSLGTDGNLIQNQHPQAGVPCQVLAYALILKIYELLGMREVSIYGEDTRVDADWQLNKGLHDLQGLSPNNPVVVTDEYARICQICAMVANKKPLEITDCSAL